MKVETLKSKARQKEREEAWGDALEAYRKAAQILEDRDDPDISLYNRIGDLELRMGDSEGAMETFDRAIELYTESGLLNNAVGVCKKLIRNVPERDEPHIRLGRIRAEQGLRADARQAFVTYAERKQAKGDLDDALEALVEFADLAPDEHGIREMVADQLASHGRTEEAVEQYLKLHRSLLSSGEEERAQEVAETIHGLDPQAEIPEEVGEEGGAAPDDFLGGAVFDPSAPVDAEDPPAGAPEDSGEGADEGPDEGLVEIGGLEGDPLGESSAGEESSPGGAIDVGGGEADDEAVPEGDAVLSDDLTLGEEPAPADGPVSEDPSASPGEADGPDDAAFSSHEGAGDGAERDAALELDDMELGGSGEDWDPLADAPAALDEGEGDADVAGAEGDDPLEGAGAEAADHQDDATLAGLGDALLDEGDGDAGESAVGDFQEPEAGPSPAGRAEVSEEEPSPPKGGYVDLGALILGDEEEEKDTRMKVPTQTPTGDEDADFTRMLEQFKEKVAENLETDNARDHYDLGTAYKGMGLIDEAIAQLQQALRADPEGLPIYEVLGQCFLEKGEPRAAIQLLERASRISVPVEDERIGLYYDLARAHEEVGNVQQAREFYEKVFTLDINFKDVTERLRRVRAGGSPS